MICRLLTCFDIPLSGLNQQKVEPNLVPFGTYLPFKVGHFNV